MVLDPEDRMMRARAVFRRLDTLARQRFDIIHIQTPFVAHHVGVRLSRRLNIPRVESYHTFFEEYLYHYVPVLPRSLLRAAARLFSRRQCNDLHGLVVPSQAMHGVLTQYGITAATRIIPTGLEQELHWAGDGAAFRVRHHIPPQRPTLVHVGRVAFEKNIDFLLRVVRELKRSHPDILLIIAGEGPAERHLRRLGQRLGLTDNVLFVGYLSRQGALADCYRAGDAFVFASRTETQGLVLLEAMSLGVPVVSTAIMGTRDILLGGQGALVAEENVMDFASKVRRLLDDADLRQRLGEQGREYAHQWTAEGPAQALLAFYEEMITGRATLSMSLSS